VSKQARGQARQTRGQREARWPETGTSLWSEGESWPEGHVQRVRAREPGSESEGRREGRGQRVKISESRFKGSRSEDQGQRVKVGE
jgi:hypothetical protein